MKETKIRFRWKDYFREFCAAHGPPVEVRNRLLFRDGWSYANGDYAGPEYPPPTDRVALVSLKVSYWEAFVKLIKVRLSRAEARKKFLIDFQSNKSVPLQMEVSYPDPDSYGKVVRTAVSGVDVASLDDTLEHLTSSLEEANRELERLRKELKDER